MKHILLTLIALLFASCSNVDLRRGAIGENCSGADEDCRVGLICNSGQCAPSNSDSITCDQVCSKFAECGARESGCASDCRITVEKWDAPIQEVFAECLINSACSDLASKEAPQICYDELELTDYKKERCDMDASDCGLGDSFLSGCYRLAKVGSAKQFDSYDQCARLVNETITCEGHQGCLDSAF